MDVAFACNAGGGSSLQSGVSNVRNGGRAAHKVQLAAYWTQTHGSTTRTFFWAKAASAACQQTSDPHTMQNDDGQRAVLNLLLGGSSLVLRLLSGSSFRSLPSNALHGSFSEAGKCSTTTTTCTIKNAPSFGLPALSWRQQPRPVPS